MEKMTRRNLLKAGTAGALLCGLGNNVVQKGKAFPEAFASAILSPFFGQQPIDRPCDVFLHQRCRQTCIVRLNSVQNSAMV